MNIHNRLEKMERQLQSGGQFLTPEHERQMREVIERSGRRDPAVALERWPLDEGWHSHQAAVLPVTKAFYEAARTALCVDVVDMEDEPEYGEIFKFS